MIEDKINMTKTSIEYLENLENIIKNPDTIMNSILNTNYNGNYVDLVISLSQFLINKEQTIIKNKPKSKYEVTYENKLLDKYTEIYWKHKGKIGIANFVYEMNFLRNAISHGQYIIDEETNDLILLESNKKISYDWLKNIIETLFSEVKIKTKKLPISTGYIAKLSTKEIDIDNIDSILNNYAMFNYKIEENSENVYDKSLELILSEIGKYKNNGKKVFKSVGMQENYKNSMQNCHDLAQFGGMKFENKLFPMTDIKEELKEKLKQTIKDNYQTLKNVNQGSLETFVEKFFNDNYYDSLDLELLDKTYMQLSTLATLVTSNKNRTYNQLKEDYYFLSPVDDMLLTATTLTKFNMIYSYNGDNILKKYLDYSKLDLSNMKPTLLINGLKYKYSKEEEIIFKLEKENNENYIQYNNLKTTKNKENINKMNEIKGNINKNKNEIYKYQLRKKRIILGEQDDVENLKKFEYNKSLITHIRNSIVHGNIEIKTPLKNNDLKTCVLILRDYYLETNSKTFELEITLDEINKLCNREFVFELLNQNKRFRSYNGFASLLVLSLVVLIEAGGTLLYILLTNGFFDLI
ncbi:MAG: hypothetical protein RSD09_01085 [Bacilli bacterium]